MGEFNPLKHHHGNTGCALSDPDPELGMIDAIILMTSRGNLGNLRHSKMPETLINLQNAMPRPRPQHFGRLIAAIQNENAVPDVAGLART